MSLTRFLRGAAVLAASSVAVLTLSAAPAAASPHFYDVYPNRCATTAEDPNPRPYNLATTVAGGQIAGSIYVFRTHTVGYHVCIMGWVKDTRGDSKGAILYATYDWVRPP